MEYHKDPVFGFDVPTSCEGVPAEILDPANTWPSREEYYKEVRRPGRALHRELQADDARVPEHVLEAGPKRLSLGSGASEPPHPRPISLPLPLGERVARDGARHQSVS